MEYWVNPSIDLHFAPLEVWVLDTSFDGPQQYLPLITVEHVIVNLPENDIEDDRNLAHR